MSGSKKFALGLLISVVVILAAFVVAGLVSNQKSSSNPINPEPAKKQPAAVANQPPQPQAIPEKPVFVSEVPKNATVTPSKNETSKGRNGKDKFFDLRATSNGFDPDTITVKKGDTLRVDFTSVDGDYDLDLPYLGAYFSKVEQGQTKTISLDTTVVGTFAFQCRSYCPEGETQQGWLVVLP